MKVAKITSNDYHNYAKSIDLSKCISYKDTQINKLFKLFEPPKVSEDTLEKMLNIKTSKEKIEEFRKNFNSITSLDENKKIFKNTIEIVKPEINLKKELSKINNKSFNKLIKDFKNQNADAFKKIKNIDFIKSYTKSFNINKEDYSKYYQHLLKELQKNISFIQEISEKISLPDTDNNHSLKEKAIFLNNTALFLETNLKDKYKSKLANKSLENIIFNLQSFYIDSISKKNIFTSSLAYFLKFLKKANLNIIMQFNKSFYYILLVELIEKVLNFIEELNEILEKCKKAKNYLINNFNDAAKKIKANQYEIITKVYNKGLIASKYKQIIGIINLIAKQKNISSSYMYKIFVYLIDISQDKKYLREQIKKYQNIKIEDILEQKNILSSLNIP